MAGCMHILTYICTFMYSREEKLTREELQKSSSLSFIQESSSIKERESIQRGQRVRTQLLGTEMDNFKRLSFQKTNMHTYKDTLNRNRKGNNGKNKSI